MIGHRSGGSSGGEGALVAMRGSVLGIGTDIGGSIRIPAYCCGVYGFKPLVFRPISLPCLPSIPNPSSNLVIQA
jgi:Asp-tRNA(Asn)/Glu-tRNA(Gln) amidotransferase A subunit family amidase